MLKWEFKNGNVIVQNIETAQVLDLGGCEEAYGNIFVNILNASPELAVRLVPPHFLEKPNLQSE